MKFESKNLSKFKKLEVNANLQVQLFGGVPTDYNINTGGGTHSVTYCNDTKHCSFDYDTDAQARVDNTSGHTITTNFYGILAPGPCEPC